MGQTGERVMPQFVPVRTIRHFDAVDFDQKIEDAMTRGIDSFRPDQDYNFQTPVKKLFNSIQAVSNLLTRIGKILRKDFMISLDIDSMDASQIWNSRTIGGLKINLKDAARE